MRAEIMSYINLGQSGPLNPLSGGTTSTRSSKATPSTQSTDQAGTTAYSGLLSLAMQLTDPAQDPRVQELRQAIGNGSYSTDLSQTARAMVDAALNLD